MPCVAYCALVLSLRCPAAFGAQLPSVPSCLWCPAAFGAQLPSVPSCTLTVIMPSRLW
ncbi:hypothetical protein BOX15_Mlig021348g1 [Macrostomum lignano]|uniref:Uncharacterized protein n=1 Tax=Macrostomum lignano TaxID=282301 RepID=A0A267F0V1_9PLAT|nr:hypothetical protein BOX15_Mlig026436g2 [Macrostomum lignano]PAA51876.1 hypothetical protein BOX15_Mlig017364g1 [Macrostomum lignano]PAA52519.1 hypothetical protein BOX15_Mlig016606g1 [Macrostomum lignano]PAA67381.1 hypothetical protein BOX15_Mlig026436g1 [Macrostomum lignano]PAA72906.1 hypothetical protein BOX15_Mlig021348g1 [Macrostomum lignano]